VSPTKLICCAIGRQEASEATIELLKTIEHPLGKQAEILVDVCSYAATGNVLKIQTMLHHCADHAPKPKTDEEDKAETPEQDTTAAAAEGESKEEKKEDAKPSDMTYQAFAVIGIALVAMGEDVGADMSLRQFNHLVRIVSSGLANSTTNEIWDFRCRMEILLCERLYLWLLV
jgi:26S proteasome regulatory subunit N1